MAMLMQNNRIDLPQEQPLGSATPSPIPTVTSIPGGGIPMPKNPGIPGGDVPMPKPQPGGETPMPKQPGVPGGDIPMPKPQPGFGETPMPKNPGVPGGDIPMPKPQPGGDPPAYAGGKIQIADWRQGLAETDKAAVTRSVQDTELTSKQLARLLDENGRYIESARLRAREGASNSGMLMSTMAAGAAERSAIDAALPIAQSDANTYFQTSSENMRAQNEDVQADQGAGRNLFGQSMGIDAQAQESELGRRFTSGENAANRTFQGEQAGMDRALTIDQNERQRQVQLLMQERGISADMARQIVDQQFTSGENRLTREQNATLEANRLSQDRFGSYVNMMAAREQQLAQTLASIYSNPNLKPAEQAAAAENARAIFNSLNSGTNAALSAGVPRIFAAPYVMDQSTPPSSPTTPSTPVQPTTPVTQPAQGTPIAGTNLMITADGRVVQRP